MTQKKSRPRNPASTKTKPARRIKPLRWSSSLENLPVLSIRQPFAWLVVNGIKDIENRSRRTHYRGPILIHASTNKSALNADNMELCQARSGLRLPEEYDVGGVIGVVEIVDCVRRHSSPWKHGPSWGWVLANARPLKFRECKGAVGFFYPKWK
jgi:ASCH domain.